MNDVTTEASARSAADSNLQRQINTHTSQIAALNTANCELYTGIYTGNGAATRNISLGFKPKAVLIMYYGFLVEKLFNTGRKNPYGGIGIDAWGMCGITLTSDGFQVEQGIATTGASIGIDILNLNQDNEVYVYLAFK